MAKVTVHIVNSEKLFSQQLRIIKDMADNDLEKIAKETEKRLQGNVLASIQRPGSTGNLAKAFYSERIPNGWGVGNIEHLDTTVPYWRWINFGRAKSGRTTPPSTGGYFGLGTPYPSQGAFRTGRFVKQSGTFFINPVNPIQAHNFIARTLQSQNIIIASVLKKRRTI